jgi:hypothetical protein
VIGRCFSVVDCGELADGVFQQFFASEAQTPRIRRSYLSQTNIVVANGARVGLIVITVVILFKCFKLIIDLVPGLVDTIGGEAGHVEGETDFEVERARLSGQRGVAAVHPVAGKRVQRGALWDQGHVGRAAEKLWLQLGGISFQRLCACYQ